jgi:hypothetical protein
MEAGDAASEAVDGEVALRKHILATAGGVVSADYLSNLRSGAEHEINLACS